MPKKREISGTEDSLGRDSKSAVRRLGDAGEDDGIVGTLTRWNRWNVDTLERWRLETLEH